METKEKKIPLKKKKSKKAIVATMLVVALLGAAAFGSWQLILQILGNCSYVIQVGGPMFIAAIDDPDGKNVSTHTVTFAMPRKGFKIRAVDGSGSVAVTMAKDGTMSVPLTTCHGVFVMAERE